MEQIWDRHHNDILGIGCNGMGVGVEFHSLNGMRDLRTDFNGDISSMSTSSAITTSTYPETGYVNPSRGLALVNGGRIAGDRVES